MSETGQPRGSEMETELSYTLSTEPCISQSPDPTDHAWETTILPPMKGSKCMCGRFVWPPVQPDPARAEGE